MQSKSKKIESLLAEYYEINSEIKAKNARLSELRNEVMVVMENENALNCGIYSALKNACQRENLDREALNIKFGKPEVDKCLNVTEFFQLRVVKS